MFSKQRSWLSGTIWKPKDPHCLEHLKYLHSLLGKNQQVTEHNRSLLVETLRAISEILIWGDQNDNSVFDFFLEKNMLSFFLCYLRQRCGRYICVQLLQTLNILFENISNETSLYYLLSNNHINCIIVHKFDFSDEEVMAYYISFLKTLSLKLNKHTVHFFFNEHSSDFALYTEAIKFFNHSESMVRIAVRTITLNVFRVDNKPMLLYLRDWTAVPYFANLVSFIENHILDLDLCVRHDMDHRSRDRLSDFVAEHLDHLHYLNDILTIGLDTLNLVLINHFLSSLFIPLYVFSLTDHASLQWVDQKRVSCVVSLFLLSQVFLIMHHPHLVQQLAQVIFQEAPEQSKDFTCAPISPQDLPPPVESSQKALKMKECKPPFGQKQFGTEEGFVSYVAADCQISAVAVASLPADVTSDVSFGVGDDNDDAEPVQNSTDEEKLIVMTHTCRNVSCNSWPFHQSFNLEKRPYCEAVFNALDCCDDDYSALLSLCLLYAMANNTGISQTMMDEIMMPSKTSKTKEKYNVLLVERLLRIIENACQSDSNVRLATLELSIKLLQQLVNTVQRSYLQDRHLACVEHARECITQRARAMYRSEEIFLDMFEDEYRQLKVRPLNVEHLMQDASILLSPTGTPLTGIDFIKRLPCGEVERTRRVIRVFFLVRCLSLSLLHESETQLPLIEEENCIKVDDVLDLNNSDLVACTVVTSDSRRQEKRFLVIDPVRMVLVEPDAKRLGWGVVRFVGFLQDVDVAGDKDDSRLLHVVVRKPSPSVQSRSTPPLLSGRFIFDDHIRCMAAKQRLVKGRRRARQLKLEAIERLLDVVRAHQSPGHVQLVYAAPSTSYSATHPSITDQPQVHSCSQGVRRVTAEQKRNLQAKAAHHCRSRQAYCVNVLQADDCVESSVDQDSTVHSLRHAVTVDGKQEEEVRDINSLKSYGRSVRLTSNDVLCERSDIPLEDLSSHGKRVRGHVIGSSFTGKVGGLSADNPLSHLLNVPSSRCHSWSPHRVRKESGSAVLSRSDKHRQSSPMRIPTPVCRSSETIGHPVDVTHHPLSAKSFLFEYSGFPFNSATSNVTVSCDDSEKDSMYRYCSGQAGLDDRHPVSTSSGATVPVQRAVGHPSGGQERSQQEAGVDGGSHNQQSGVAKNYVEDSL